LTEPAVTSFVPITGTLFTDSENTTTRHQPDRGARHRLRPATGDAPAPVDRARSRTRRLRAATTPGSRRHKALARFPEEA
jgi:hypothetical protein